MSMQLVRTGDVAPNAKVVLMVCGLMIIAPVHKITMVTS